MALYSPAQIDTDGDSEMAADEADSEAKPAPKSAAAKPKAKAQAKKAAAKARLMLSFAVADWRHVSWRRWLKTIMQLKRRRCVILG